MPSPPSKMMKFKELFKTMLLSGMGYPEIGKKFSCSKGVVRGVVGADFAQYLAEVKRSNQYIALKLLKNAKINEETKCIEWTGCTAIYDGYGRVVFQGKRCNVHRVSYLLHYGTLGENMVVCHKCDNPLCFNPEHLFLGTQRDNVLDMMMKGRSRRVDHYKAPVKRKYLPKKLTPEDVAKIRELRFLGQHTAKEIAAMFNVKEGAIHKVALYITHRY